ncbi:beta-1,3-glucanase family protein [Flavobacterium myungsuense]|uniref:Beta-1,3-glucanase family protein n=1 Tax=Flavobacterium myungsuense TaxID=651823 RepID=A0ABW3J2V2_9FLAO
MKIITLFLISLLFFVPNSFSQTLKLPYVFENNSEYLDSEIYIALVGKYETMGDVWMNMSTSNLIKMNAADNTVSGPSWSSPAEWKYPNIFMKLSDIPNKTIQIPKELFASRIFISFKSPMYLHFLKTGGYAGANLNSSSDPNDGIRWELIELTWGGSGLFTNTSRVDAYQYPMGIEVYGFTGSVNSSLNYEQNYANAIAGEGIPKYSKVGELLSHNEIMSLWDTSVSNEYLVCKTIKTNSLDGKPIIEQPTKLPVFSKTALDSYINDIWNTYSSKDLTINIGENGVWVGRVTGNAFNFTDSRDGSIATIYSKPTTANAIDGSGSMAYTPVNTSTNNVKYNEDLMIQAQISAAINRHAINTNITGSTIQYTHDSSLFFKIKPYNEYVAFFHKDNISYDSKTYAFAYDDVGDHSSTIQCTYPTNVKVIIGGLVGKNASLSKISIMPQITSLNLNSTQKFSAQGYDVDDNTFPTNIIWSITSGNGTIAPNGLFSPTLSGPVTIKATDGLVSTTLSFMVEDTTPIITDPCNSVATNGQYSYTVTNTSNPTITFKPTISTTGNKVCILYYSKSATGPFNGYNVTPNVPYQINATLGEKIYFYYTYSLASGGENTTINKLHTLTIGGCNSLNISNNAFADKIVVYPNPTNGQNLKILGEIEKVEILIYSLIGGLVKSKVIKDQNELLINTTDLSKGLYLLKVIQKNSRQVKTFKIYVN